MSGQDEDDVNQETTPLTQAHYAATTASTPKSGHRNGSSTVRRRSLQSQTKKYRKSVVSGDSYGCHGLAKKEKKNINCQSLSYVADESDVWRAHWTVEHFNLRGRFWNHAKFKMLQTYSWIVLTGIVQAAIAYGTNASSKIFIDVSTV